MFLRDAYGEEHRTLTRVDTSDNTADVFTKPMPRDGFDRHCASLGLVTLGDLLVF